MFLRMQYIELYNVNSSPRLNRTIGNPDDQESSILTVIQVSPGSIALTYTEHLRSRNKTSLSCNSKHETYPCGIMRLWSFCMLSFSTSASKFFL